MLSLFYLLDILAALVIFGAVIGLRAMGRLSRIDYQMPLLDGIAATRLLCAAGFGPVILATGGDYAGITPVTLAAGAALVLAKDTLVNDLEGAIRQALRSISSRSTR